VADKNVVSQEYRLNTKSYVEGLRKLKTEIKTTISQVNKDLHQNARSWDDLTNNVKLNAASIAKEMKELGKGALKNIATGLTVGGGAAAASAARNSIGQSVKAMLSFGEAMSRVQLKTGASKKQIDELQDSMAELARSGTSLSSIPDAFDEIFSATGNVEKSMPVLKQVSNFASGTTSKDASQVAEFVRRTLTSENKTVDEGNTKGLLDSLAKMMKTGGFKTLDEAMAGFGGVNTGAMSNIKMTNQSAAGMLSAASTVANKEQSLAAVNELIKGAGTGFAGNAVLSGIMGANLVKNGQLDTQQLAKASERFKSKGYSDQGFKELLAGTGLSEDAVNGLTNILRNSDKFAQGIQNFEKSTVTADEAVTALNDNFSGKLIRAGENISASFFELFHHLADLDFSKVIGDVVKHWQSLAGGLGLASGGALAGSLALKTAAGMLGLGGSGAAASGAAASATAAGEAAFVPINMLGVGAAPAAATGGGLTAGGVAAAAAPAAAAVGVGLAASEAFKYLAGGGFEEDIKSLIEHLKGADEKKQSIFVEVNSKDPGFVAKPKSGDLRRDPRGL